MVEAFRMKRGKLLFACPFGWHFNGFVILFVFIL